AFWMRSDGPPASRQRPFGIADAFETWQDPDGILHFDLGISGSPDTFATSGSVATAGRWYHIVAQFNSDTDEIEVYVNGELDHAETYPQDLTDQPAAPFTFADRTGAGQNFSGALDDFRIYNRWLTAAEISELYGLVGHWKLDETSGVVAADSSGLGNDATHYSGGTIAAAGPYPGVGVIAAEYDGVNDVTQTDAEFDPPATGAVAFWMRGSGTPTARQRLFGINGDWEVRLETNGRLSFDLGASPFVGNEPFVTPDAVDVDGRWYHVVANFDAADDSFDVYVNGKLVNSGYSTRDLVSQASGILSIGTRTGNGEYWEGAMHDLRIYDRELFGIEITKLYGLVGHWKLNEMTGSTAMDSSLAGHHGVIEGGTTLGVTGVADTAMSFEGPGDRVVVPESTLLNETVTSTAEDFAILFWVKPNSSGNGSFRTLFQKGATDTPRAPGIWLNPNDNGIHIKIGTSHSDEAMPSVATLATAVWSHVALVSDAGQFRLYVNGVLDRQKTLDGIITGNNGPVYIGESYPYFEPPGGMDDVLFFNRAVSPDEISEIAKGINDGGIRIMKWVEVR
ncbi:MAG: LamG domain-containing protein, partial [Planctomycetota bacterium]